MTTTTTLCASSETQASAAGGAVHQPETVNMTGGTDVSEGSLSNAPQNKHTTSNIRPQIAPARTPNGLGLGLSSSQGGAAASAPLMGPRTPDATVKDEPSDRANASTNIDRVRTGPNYMRPYDESPRNTRKLRDLAVNCIMSAWPATPHTQWLPLPLVPDDFRSTAAGQDQTSLRKAHDWDTRLLKKLSAIAAATRGNRARAHEAMLAVYTRSLSVGHEVDVDIKSLLHLLDNVEGLSAPTADSQSQKRPRREEPDDDRGFEITGSGPCKKQALAADDSGASLTGRTADAAAQASDGAGAADQAKASESRRETATDHRRVEEAKLMLELASAKRDVIENKLILHRLS